METKIKYIKFEQDAIILLGSSDGLDIPLKDLKICELCTLSYKKSVYHYFPSAPVRSVSPDVVGIKSWVDNPQEETGGGFTIISMGKIEDKED